MSFQRRMRCAALVFGIVGWLAACGGDNPKSDASPDVETAVDDASETTTETVAETTDASETDGSDSETPILQRAPAATFFACDAVRAADFAPPEGYHHEFAQAAGGLFLLADRMTYIDQDWMHTIGLYRIGTVSGTHAADPALFEQDYGRYGAQALDVAATPGGDLAFAWQPFLNTEPMRFGILTPGTSGATLRIAPKALPGTIGGVPRLTLLALADRVEGSEAAFVVVWQTYVAGGWDPLLKMVTLDAAGDPLGAPVDIVPADQAGESDTRFAVRATRDGILVVWAAEKSGVSTIHTARFDLAGKPLGTPHALTTTGRAVYPALLADGAGWLAAWSSGATLVLAKLDADGALIGSPVPLGPAPAGAAVGLPLGGQPVLARMDDVVALGWAMSDDAPTAGEGTWPLMLLLIDPATLAPASPLVTQWQTGGGEAGVNDGRIARLRLEVSGHNLFASFALALHAGSGWGAFDITCHAP